LINQDLSPHFEERMKTEILLSELTQEQQKGHGQKEAAKIAHRLEKLKERMTFLDKLIARQTTKYWRGFQSLSNILNIAGYLNANKPTLLGHMAQGVRGSNELFLCEVFISGVLETLAADELSAVLTALVTEASRYDDRLRGGRGNAEALSPQVEYALGQTAKIARQVSKWQRQFSVDIPVEFGTTFCYFSQQWAQGISWGELAKMAQLKRVDEGDVVRALRRTLDLCRQIKRAPGMNEILVQICMETEKLISRDEISEDV
jgi:superfamily II RNA helicase